MGEAAAGVAVEESVVREMSIVEFGLPNELNFIRQSAFAIRHLSKVPHRQMPDRAEQKDVVHVIDDLLAFPVPVAKDLSVEFLSGIGRAPGYFSWTGATRCGKTEQQQCKFLHRCDLPVVVLLRRSEDLS